MTPRRKLIDLMIEAEDKLCNTECDECGYGSENNRRCLLYLLADYLLAHGVIVPTSEHKEPDGTIVREYRR